MVVEEVFAVIAEGTRRDILQALSKEHKAVGQLVDELGVSQPTVSKHLRVLREAGVVTMRAQGQKRYYSINTEPLMLVSEWLDSLGAGLARGSRAASRPAARAAGAAAPAVSTVPTPEVGTVHAPVAPVRQSPAAAILEKAPDDAARRPVHVPAKSVATGNAVQTTSRPGAAVSPAAAAQGGVVAHPPATAVVIAGEAEASVQQQITRSVGRAANKAADLLANLPAFRRRKD
jgi:DNA-binding transcriptional ArsR family regulator